MGRRVIQVFLCPLNPCRWTCRVMRRRRRSLWTAPAPRTHKTALHLLAPNSQALRLTSQLPSNHPPLPSKIAGSQPSPTGLRACLPSLIWTTTTRLCVDPWGGVPPLPVLPAQPTTMATTLLPVTLPVPPHSAPAADTLWNRRRSSHVPAAASLAFASPHFVSELNHAETPTRT